MSSASPTVPDDFPRDYFLGAISGFQPKVLAREIDGKYVTGPTPEELYARWDNCEDLARQLMEKTVRKVKSGVVKESDLEAYYVGIEGLVRQQPWGLSQGEVTWLMNRAKVWVAQELLGDRG